MANDRSSYRPNDEQMAFRFKVYIPGLEESGFEKVTGLGGEIDHIERRNGDEPNRMRKLPGLTKFNDITFSKGVTKSNELYEWWEATKDLALQGQSADAIRKTLTVEEIGAGDSVTKVWRLIDCLPKSFKGGDFDSMASEALIEELVISPEDVKLDSGSSSSSLLSGNNYAA